MARIRVQDENREITNHQEIREFLKPFGISYENWDVEGRVGQRRQTKKFWTLMPQRSNVSRNKGDL